ncbi:beta-L-arabinofuranosidase domain-containing protein [Streptomyces sp. NPDC059894]|uniref:beta-L-arabinofuranosidase domain-containing protein n=1 Tax=unclassified Streptomyces TaxID=2593676 RepID=UPI003650ACC4
MNVSKSSATAAAAVTTIAPPVAAHAAGPEARPVTGPPDAGPPATGPALAAFELSDVRLLDSPFLANMRRTRAYLLFVDADRLLHTFRRTVGLPSSAEPCGGWEAPDIQLRGHVRHGGAATYATAARPGRRAMATMGRGDGPTTGAGQRPGSVRPGAVPPPGPARMRRSTDS